MKYKLVALAGISVSLSAQTFSQVPPPTLRWEVVTNLTTVNVRYKNLKVVENSSAYAKPLHTLGSGFFAPQKVYEETIQPAQHFTAPFATLMDLMQSFDAQVDVDAVFANHELLIRLDANCDMGTITLVAPGGATYQLPFGDAVQVVYGFKPDALFPTVQYRRNRFFTNNIHQNGFKQRLTTSLMIGGEISNEDYDAIPGI